MDAELLRGLIQELCAIPEVVVNPDYDALRRRADAALSVAQGQGFVMVPREATPQMVMAFQSGEPGDKSFWGCYRAMLAAAPAQPDGVSK